MIKKYKHIDLCTPIDKIEFGQGNDIRIHNAFRFYEIETVLDLCKMSRNAFLRIRSCGVRTIRAIEATLADYGLELEMDEKSIEEYQRYHSFVVGTKLQKRFILTSYQTIPKIVLNWL